MSKTMCELIKIAECVNRDLISTHCTHSDVASALAKHCAYWLESDRDAVAILAARLAEGFFVSGDGEWQKWKRLSLATEAYLDGQSVGSRSDAVPAISFALAEFAHFGEDNEGRTVFSAPTLTNNSEGATMHLTKTSEPHASVSDRRPVQDLDFYAFRLDVLAYELKVSRTKLRWFIETVGMQEKKEYFKEFTMGAMKFKRYSHACLVMLRHRLQSFDLNSGFDAARRARRTRRRGTPTGGR